MYYQSIGWFSNFVALRVCIFDHYLPPTYSSLNYYVQVSKFQFIQAIMYQASVYQKIIFGAYNVLSSLCLGCLLNQQSGMYQLPAHPRPGRVHSMVELEKTWEYVNIYFFISKGVFPFTQYQFQRLLRYTGKNLHLCFLLTVLLWLANAYNQSCN